LAVQIQPCRRFRSGCAEQRVVIALPTLVKAFITAVAGIALGLWLTFTAVERGFGFGIVEVGPWTLVPKAGSPDADPYARASYARSGEIPLGVAEGLTFFARRDSEGEPLDSRCDYAVAGSLPVARFWTLSVLDPAGRPIANVAGRAGFTSSELLRDADGAAVITLSAHARPGNWLALNEGAPFVLMLRLYDTAAGATMSSFDRAAVPGVVKGRCS
jgi:hypothetical protein